MELLGNYNRLELRKQLEKKAEEIINAIPKHLGNSLDILDDFDKSNHIEQCYVGIVDDEDIKIYEHPDYVHIKFELSYFPLELQIFCKRLEFGFLIVDFDFYYDTKFMYDILFSSRDIIMKQEDYYKRNRLL